MYRVLGCLTTQHDLVLVLVAAFVCVIGTMSISVAVERTLADRSGVRWPLLLAVCAGTAVWSTHFVAMLAYETGIPMAYDPFLTGLSFVVGSVVMGIGFEIARRTGDHWSGRALAGIVVSAGVSALHYIGMAAIRLSGTVQFAPDLVIASVVLACLIGSAAMIVLYSAQRRQTRALAVALLVLMIVSLHFTGMGAVTLFMGGIVPGSGSGLSRTVLAAVVAGAALLMLGIGVAAARLERRASLRLEAEADRFRMLSEGTFEGLIVHRAGSILDANSAARQMFAMDGVLTGTELQHWILDARRLLVRDADAESDRIETELKLRSGHCFPAEVRRRSIVMPDGGAAELLAFRDLTAQRESEARIAHLALHDPLTDLPNRRFFVEMVNKTIAGAARGRRSFALLALDLDGFKLVNDLYGHAGGDELIRAFSRRISEHLRAGDVLARLGGDEFAILQSDVTHPEQSISLAQRLVDALREPVRIGHTDCTVSASIGVAVYPSDGDEVDDLIRNADTAMYRAKADGKATFRFFEAGMNEVLEQRRRLEQRLRVALAGEGMGLAYQPLVDCGARDVIGFEVLARWVDAELGPVAPLEFIPVAEESGLIVRLGDYVLKKACREAATWPSHLKVAVNLSAVQFRRDGLVQSVREALAESGLPGHRLDLEITENILIENRDYVLKVLTELKSLGVTISMDDFGTGYSSLSYLKSFPFDKIKIDREFVSELDTENGNTSIVRAITSMGKSLQMRVVAEGVETRSQAEILRELDCDELQGFLIARPMPPEEVASFLERFCDDAEGRVYGPRGGPRLVAGAGGD